MHLHVRVHTMMSVRLPALLLILGLFAAVDAAAQTVPPPGTSAEEIQRQISARGLQSSVLQRIQQSGMSPDQIRQRLASMGYDPSVLDPYLERGETEPPQPSSSAVTAAEALGLLAPQTQTESEAGADAGRALDSLAMQPSLPDSTALERERGLRVFGLQVFARPTSEFEPVTTGPVPPGYRVGPGDELVLILTGDVEQQYVLPVTREGFIVIPQVGQVWVNGLTMEDIRDQMFTHLGRSYSGISRGPEATTHFQLTLGQLRPNQVFVTGQVARPGAYLVNAVASTLNALYRGGGPLPTGSFRDVRIMRSGELAQRIDLYDYLLQGDNLADIQLQPGDVIFVPTPSPQVSIKGEVARPAIYEVVENETLADLIQFAGGLTAPAQTRRARIERILPPNERTEPGVDRVVIDVDLEEALADAEAAPRLRDGDAVRIFPVRPELRSSVSIQGAVWGSVDSVRSTTRPDSAADEMEAILKEREEAARANTYRYFDGMRLWDLIDRAGGLRDDAYLGRAQIVRVDPRDSTLFMVPTTLEHDASGQPVANPELREFDTVRVFRKADFTTDFPVAIVGDVRNPLNTTFEEGMTLRDLILRGGGLNPTADLAIEVARLPGPSARGTDTIAELYEVRVDSSFLVSDQAKQFYLGEFAEDAGPAAGFQLKPYDRVTVRELPDLEMQRSVEIRGLVRKPGFYTLQHKEEHLSSVVGRAGGLKSEAHIDGARFFREGVRVNVDLQAALADPGGDADIVMIRDDSLFVPQYNPVVIVTGAVNSAPPVAVQFRPGASLDYYIDNAGGYARNADEDRVHVRYANGEGATMGRFLMFSRAPEPAAGATITVPYIPEGDKVNVPALVGDIAQIAATLTTVALVIARF